MNTGQSVGSAAYRQDKGNKNRYLDTIGIRNNGRGDIRPVQGNVEEADPAPTGTQKVDCVTLAGEPTQWSQGRD